MGLNPLKWKSRNLLVFILGLVVFYTLLIHKRTYLESFEATVENSKPVTVWEFVADFNNMKMLNPTIENFNILADSSNIDHWKYSVQYTEHLSHLPSIKNTAHGDYSIKPEDDGFVIRSEHRTCFFSSYGCVDSISEFTFRANGKNTECRETVQYECPLGFSILCHKEVMYQRREIMRRLKQHFAITKTVVLDDK